MTQQDIQVVLEIILVLIGLHLAFFKSYFQEKGKNLATQEDIGKITREIKSVESKINIVTNNIISYDSIKRQALLDYFGAYNNWERNVVLANISTDDDFEEENKRTLEKISDAKYKYNLREGEIELFIDDENFYKLRFPLTIKIMELQHNLSQHIATTNYIIRSETDLKERYAKLETENSNYHTFLVENQKGMRTLRNNLTQYLDNILKEIMK